MRSYPVKVKTYFSVVSEIFRYKHTDRHTQIPSFCYKASSRLGRKIYKKDEEEIQLTKKMDTYFNLVLHKCFILKIEKILFPFSIDTNLINLKDEKKRICCQEFLIHKSLYKRKCKN